ncbi:MAG: hypothetical protein ACO3JL_13235, partial [Myxococcota bacterium]
AGRGRAAFPASWAAVRTAVGGRYQPALRHTGGIFRLSGRFVADGDVVLYLRSDRGARVLLDGVQVAERNPEFEDLESTTRVELQLQPGHHRLELLVVAESPVDAVEIALLDHQGVPVWSETSAEASSPVAGLTFRNVTVPSLAVASIDGDDPLARLDALLLQAALAGVGASHHGRDRRELIRTLLEEYAAVPSALVAVARLVVSEPRLPSALVTADALVLWREVAQRWPTHPEALLALAESLAEQQPLEALHRYREIQRAHPQLVVGHAGVLSLALALDLVSEALQAADALRDLGGGPALTLLPLAVYERLERHEQRAKLDSDAWSTGPRLAPERALAEGRRNEALTGLLDLLRVDEGSAAAELCWDTLAGEDPSAALSLVEEHLRRFPADRSAWRRVVALRTLQNDVMGAKAAVAAGLNAAGADLSLWLASVELGDEAPWDAEVRIGERLIEEHRRRGALEFPIHRYGFLRDHAARKFFPDGSSLVLRHFLIELSSAEALDDFGELRFPQGDTLIRLRVVKPDGSERFPEILEGVDDLSFTGLEVGDLLEGMVVGEAQSRDGVPCGELVPLVTEVPAKVRSRQYDVPLTLIDEGFTPMAVGGASPPKVTTSETEARARYDFVHHDAPALAPEPHAPADIEAAPAVGYRCGAAEEPWRIMRGTSIMRAAKDDPWLRSAAERIAGEGTREQRWRRLFRFVVTHIEESDAPADAVAVLAGGRGRRLPLLLALSKAVKLEVRPFALHPTTSPPLDLGAKEAWPLVGAMARVGTRWSVALVDDGLALLDALPASFAGSAVLDLSLAQAPLELQVESFSTSPVRVRAALTGQIAGMEGYIAITVPTPRAEGLRRWLRSTPAEEQRGAFEAALSSSLPGLRVVQVSAPGLDAAGAPLGIGLDVEVPWHVGADGRARLDGLFAYGAAAPLGLFPSLQGFLQVSARARPLLAVATSEVLELELTLPEGAVFLDTPAPRQARAGFVSMEQQVEVNEGTLRWRRALDVENQRVSVDDWPAIRPALTELVRRTEADVEVLFPSTVQRETEASQTPSSP